MNILVFSPEPSHPQHLGNRKRIFTLTKYMQSKGHRIHFVYFTQNGLNRKNFNLMQDEWDTFTFIEMHKPIQYRIGNYELDEWYQDDIQSIVNQIIEDFDIKMVLINYLMQSKFLEFIPSGVLKVIDTHDSFADRYKLYEENNAPEYKWYSIGKKDEIKGLNRADIILAIQEEEEAYFSLVAEKPVMTINHLERKHFLDRNYNSLKKIGFIGSSNQINVHAIQAFLREFIQSDLSQYIQVVLAGQICNSIKIEHKNINRMGIVDTLDIFYKEVDLIINPLLFGTGLKIKSVEAMAYGAPIISTKIGFEGIESQTECHHLNSIADMIACIRTIHEEPAMLMELRSTSREIFEKYEQNVVSKIGILLDQADVGSMVDAEGKALCVEKISHKHNELQRLKFDSYESRIKAHTKSIAYKKILQTLDAAFSELISIKFRHHPLRKLKACKKLIKTYYTTKKELFKGCGK